jgi:hypothetical protein
MGIFSESADNTSIDKLGRQTKVTRPNHAGDPQGRFTVNRCDAVGNQGGRVLL